MIRLAGPNDGKIYLGNVSDNDQNEVKAGANIWIKEDDFDCYDGYGEDDSGYNYDDWN